MAAGEIILKRVAPFTGAWIEITAGPHVSLLSVD